jgi:hypothetical protein
MSPSSSNSERVYFIATILSKFAADVSEAESDFIIDSVLCETSRSPRNRLADMRLQVLSHMFIIIIISCCFHFWSIRHPWNFVSLQFLNLGQSVGTLGRVTSSHKHCLIPSEQVQQLMLQVYPYTLEQSTVALVQLTTCSKGKFIHLLTCFEVLTFMHAYVSCQTSGTVSVTYLRHRCLLQRFVFPWEHIFAHKHGSPTSLSDGEACIFLIQAFCRQIRLLPDWTGAVSFRLMNQRNRWVYK